MFPRYPFEVDEALLGETYPVALGRGVKIDHGALYPISIASTAYSQASPYEIDRSGKSIVVYDLPSGVRCFARFNERNGPRFELFAGFQRSVIFEKVYVDFDGSTVASGLPIVEIGTFIQTSLAGSSKAPLVIEFASQKNAVSQQSDTAALTAAAPTFFSGALSALWRLVDLYVTNEGPDTIFVNPIKTAADRTSASDRGIILPPTLQPVRFAPGRAQDGFSINLATPTPWNGANARVSYSVTYWQV